MAVPTTTRNAARAEKYRPSGWLSGQQTAARLGKTLKEINRLVSRGYLHPVIKNGLRFYASSELENLAKPGPRPAPWLAGPSRRSKKPPNASARRRTHGEEAALVFQLLHADKSLREIVIRSRVPPHRVRSLYREWRLALEQGRPETPRDDGVPTPDAVTATLARFDQLHHAPGTVTGRAPKSTRAQSSTVRSLDRDPAIDAAAPDNLALLATAAERIFGGHRD
jgi:hypothetical protein